jgi:hypothetical protein
LQELIQRIGQARPTIDNGMLRVGPRLDKASRVDALLTGAASRALSLADAVVQLCRQDHANEALPVLRQLAEIAVAVRNTKTEERAAEILESWESPCWESLWPREGFPARAREAGLGEERISRLETLCRDFTRANRAVIPWSHVYSENQHPGADSATVLGLTSAMLGHLLLGLEARWPEAFPGAEAFEP